MQNTFTAAKYRRDFFAAMRLCRHAALQMIGKGSDPTKNETITFPVVGKELISLHFLWNRSSIPQKMKRVPLLSTQSNSMFERFLTENVRAALSDTPSFCSMARGKPEKRLRPF